MINFRSFVLKRNFHFSEKWKARPPLYRYNHCTNIFTFRTYTIQCKESIVIVKHSTLKFSHIYTFSGLRNLFMLFSGWCMYVCVCVWVNTMVSKRCNRLSSNLVCKLQVAIRQTQLILVNIGCIVFFFTGVQERILIHYGLWSQIL